MKYYIYSIATKKWEQVPKTTYSFGTDWEQIIDFFGDKAMACFDLTLDRYGRLIDADGFVYAEGSI